MNLSKGFTISIFVYIIHEQKVKLKFDLLNKKSAQLLFGNYYLETNMLRAPQSSLLTENSLALFLDYYQLTIGQADFKRNNNTICTENYFIRRIPQGKYLIVAGLEQVIHYILNLKFTDDDLSWLKNTAPGMKLETDFVDYLRNFKFDGDIYACQKAHGLLPVSQSSTLPVSLLMYKYLKPIY